MFVRINNYALGLGMENACIPIWQIDFVVRSRSVCFALTSCSLNISRERDTRTTYSKMGALWRIGIEQAINIAEESGLNLRVAT